MYEEEEEEEDLRKTPPLVSEEESSSSERREVRVDTGLVRRLRLHCERGNNLKKIKKNHE